MKYFLFFFFIITTSHSQNGKISYTSNLNFGGAGIKEATNYLYFTTEASFYQSELNNDLKTGKTEETNETSEGNKSIEVNIRVGSDTIGNVYYNNLQIKTLICRVGVYENRALKYYIYKDSASINWELISEFKDISGYNCQKAITAFRGRNYEAWFTSEIPLSFGPWKFGGLPGLILEVYDQTGEIYFSAEQIEIPFSDASKKMYEPADVPLISYQAFIDKKDDLAASMAQAILARSPKGTTLGSVKVEKNGIELEYPWEKE